MYLCQNTQTNDNKRPIFPISQVSYLLSFVPCCSNDDTLTEMITNFEPQTYELNEYEHNYLLPTIADGLSTKIGKEKAITNKAICKALKDKGYKISDTRLRKVVHYIRIKNFVPLLIATSKGYYVATEREEVETYIKSLSERINSISEVKNSLIKQLSHA